MAESNRLYRDLAAARGSDAPRAEPEDPLAELARLIGQNVPMQRTGRAAPPAVAEEMFDESHSTSSQAAHEEHFEQRYDPREAAHPRADEDSRQTSWADAGDQGYDYDDQSQAELDEEGYGDDYEEDQISRRRGGVVFVAAIFGLAVLGTAGAFAYRAIFSTSMVPSLPPIIKAEGGPNKIIPNDTGSTKILSRQADATSAGSSERLVSREEQPVDVSPPVSGAPRTVATVPVFPDPPSPASSAASASAFPASSAPFPPPPAARVDSPSGPAVAPAKSTPGNQVANAPWPAPAAASSAPPAPKKIRTVSIRTDQPSADPSANLPASQTTLLRPAGQQQAAKPAGADSNGPLSIVPSGPDTTATAAAHPRAAPPHPAPLNKPAPVETASAAPAASGGGYAVQVSSQHSEEEAQSSFRALQAKYPDQLGGRQPIMRRADLGDKGIYYRAMVGPFASAQEATQLCSDLKAAGGSCIVQKN